MKYQRIKITAGEQEQELLISSLDEMNATGFEQQANELIAYIGEADFKESQLHLLLSDYKYTIDTIQEQNWNELWESNFQPVVVDRFCAIRADFHKPINGAEHEIIITPKMSFGTGHHATTYMMIQQMQNLNFQNKKVFDFGTGTGILAILSQKLGAANVVATDIDEWSINNATENIEKNNCSHMQLYQSAVVPDNASFHVILANINKNVILENLASLAGILTADGNIVLSGILVEDEKDIMAACKNVNLTFIRRAEQQKWIALRFVNVKSRSSF